MVVGDPEATPITSIPYCCYLPVLTRFERCNRMVPSLIVTVALSFTQWHARGESGCNNFVQIK
jgi:hypothetical protein